jgi:geranylgeranyl diphosphate synthase type II
MVDDLSRYLHDGRGRVEARLAAKLNSVADCPPALMEAMRYSLLAPGKRLRPILVMLASEAAEGTADSAMPAACAVEMIHAYSLVHDDLPAMDDDDLRRGQPTCHKQFGEALAILAGDALLTLAFQVLTEGYPPLTAANCCRELARAAGAAGMVGGQATDLAWEGRNGSMPRSTAGPADLEAVHACKTGALFRACLQLGVWASQGERAEGPDRALLARLDAYGRCFGQAFQITDDVLDVAGKMEQTGKRVHKDAVRGKLTYPSLLGVGESRRRAELLCREAQMHLQSLGQAGQRLAALVQGLLERDR